MGLIAAEIERRGIPTVIFSCLEAIMEKVGVPRRLVLPFPLGYPLGKPSDPEGQREVLRQGLALASENGPPPVLRPLNP